MAIPTLAILCLVIAYPLIYCLQLSFRTFNMISPSKERPFIGFANYIWLFHYDRFWNSVMVTGIFVTISMCIQLVLGLALALLLNQNLKDKGVLRTLFLFPLFIAPIVVALQWRWMFIAEYGLVNSILTVLGVDGPAWLSETWPAMWAIIIANSWVATPFVMVILLAGLQSMPSEPFEAVKIDGASVLQTFWFITLPLLRPTILVILVIRLMDAIRTFDQVFVLTAGGPAGSTELLSLFLYRISFLHFRLGRASALSIITLAIITAVSVILIKILRRKTV